MRASPRPSSYTRSLSLCFVCGALSPLLVRSSSVPGCTETQMYHLLLSLLFPPFLYFFSTFFLSFYLLCGAVVMCVGLTVSVCLSFFRYQSIYFLCVTIYLFILLSPFLLFRCYFLSFIFPLFYIFFLLFFFTYLSAFSFSV